MALPEFKKATKLQARARVALIGLSGGGKTYTALALATELSERVAVIDTERGSASKYSDIFNFDVLELESFGPKTYVEAIQAAEAAGYEVIVIDSLSHAWMGKDGALEQVDKAAKRNQGNSFAAWRDVTPQHNELVDAMLRCKAHVIVTMRAKTEYLQEKDTKTGKATIRKIGLQPVQRDGLEYEFDVVGDMTQDNELIVSKTRCPKLSGAVIPKPGREFAGTLKAWLSDGAPAEEKKPDLKIVKPEPKPEAATATPMCDKHTATDIAILWKDYGPKDRDGKPLSQVAWLKEKHGVEKWSALPLSTAKGIFDGLRKREALAKKAAENQADAVEDERAAVAASLPHEALAVVRAEWLRLGGKEHSILREMDKRFSVGVYAELSDEQATELLQWLQKCILDVGVS
jgi:hypothetical protein